jgi:hypothetical protein
LTNSKSTKGVSIGIVFFLIAVIGAAIYFNMDKLKLAPEDFLTGCASSLESVRKIATKNETGLLRVEDVSRLDSFSKICSVNMKSGAFGINHYTLSSCDLEKVRQGLENPQDLSMDDLIARVRILFPHTVLEDASKLFGIEFAEQV